MRDREHSKQFFALHERGFSLPNAWDAASARVFEQAGFDAIGTTSAGIAYALGYQDGQVLTRETMLQEVRRMIRHVRVPVNVDIEAGYGDSASDVALTVTAFAHLGVAGLNLEDATGQAEQPLYSLEAQQRRIEAARRAADATGNTIFLNARTDTYLAAVGEDEEARFAETVRRGHAYLEAGANSIFTPLVTDPVVIRALKTEIGGPIAVMAFPGAPSVAELLAAGASRVSIGHSAMVATLGLISRVAQELKQTGTYRAMESNFYGFQEAHDLFSPRSAPVESVYPLMEDYPVGSQRRT